MWNGRVVSDKHATGKCVHTCMVNLMVSAACACSRIGTASVLGAGNMACTAAGMPHSTCQTLVSKCSTLTVGAVLQCEHVHVA